MGLGSCYFLLNLQNVQCPFWFFETSLVKVFTECSFLLLCTQIIAKNKCSISESHCVLFSSERLSRTRTVFEACILQTTFMLKLLIIDWKLEGPAIYKSLKFYFTVSKNAKVVVYREQVLLFLWTLVLQIERLDRPFPQSSSAVL